MVEATRESATIAEDVLIMFLQEEQINYKFNASIDSPIGLILPSCSKIRCFSNRVDVLIRIVVNNRGDGEEDRQQIQLPGSNSTVFYAYSEKRYKTRVSQDYENKVQEITVFVVP